MSASLAVPASRMTVQQYLEWARRQPTGRYELVDGVPVAMSPERNVHALVKGAVYRAFLEAVSESRLDHVVLPDGPTVVISGHQSREPDVAVQSREGIDWNSTTIDSPIVLVEVTSPTTMRTDTDDKLIEYFSLASVQHYVLVHPSQRTTVHHRRVANNSIETRIVSDGCLQFEPPGFSVRVERFFADLPLGKAN